VADENPHPALSQRERGKPSRRKIVTIWGEGDFHCHIWGRCPLRQAQGKLGTAGALIAKHTRATIAPHCIRCSAGKRAADARISKSHIQPLSRVHRLFRSCAFRCSSCNGYSRNCLILFITTRKSFKALFCNLDLYRNDSQFPWLAIANSSLNP